MTNKIELSEGNTSLWVTSPHNARVRIANIVQHNPINGIDSQAYAKLFASAPELLEALEEAYKWIDDCGVQTGVDSFLNEVLEPAINKAKGI